MAVSNNSLGDLILRIALGLFLLALGILTIPGGGIKDILGANEVASAIRGLFDGNLEKIMLWLVGICTILAGAGIILSFFMPLGAFSNIFYLVVLIVWALVIVLVDIFGNGGLLNGAFNNFRAFIGFLSSLAYHMLVLGAMLVVRRD